MKTLLILTMINLSMAGCVTWHTEDISGTTEIHSYDLTKPKPCGVEQLGIGDGYGSVCREVDTAEFGPMYLWVWEGGMK